jgi:predicted O-methyltransferase YrrM
MSHSSRNRAIYQYFTSLLSPLQASFAPILEASKAAGLPAIHVAPQTGQLLYLLATMHRAKYILEIGTLGGYSTAWLAKALSSRGKILTIDCFENHLKVAKANLIRVGLERKVDMRQGKALDILPSLRGGRLFDLVFIDADKANYPFYLEEVLPLTKRGGWILSDNLIPKEERIGDPDPHDKEAVALYAFNRLITSHPQLETTFIPLFTRRGERIDALGLCRVR